MTLPAIGSLSAPGASGRAGVVVDARPLGTPQDGRQLVALTVKVADAGDCADCGEKDPLKPPPAGSFAAGTGSGAGQGEAAARGYGELSSEERGVVDGLRQRDQQVKQEEKAHAGAAGDAAGPISYVYQLGPDGRLYAVGGSVPIKAQTFTGDPNEARALGARISAAANAATNPSGADLSAARLGYGFQARANAQESSQAADGAAEAGSAEQRRRGAELDLQA